MKYILIGILLLFGSVGAKSETHTKREMVEELMELMNLSSTIDPINSQMRVMFQNMYEELGIKPSEQVIFDEYRSKMVYVLEKVMTWENIKEPITDIYINNFSEKEISDVIAFYKTDTGQAFIIKTPKLTEESMLVSQNLLMAIMPTIQKMTKELKQELAEAREEVDKN